MYTLSVPGWRSEATGAARKAARRHVARHAAPERPAGGEDKTLFAPGTTLVYTPHPYKSPFKKGSGALQSSSNCSKIPHHFEISWR